MHHCTPFAPLEVHYMSGLVVPVAPHPPADDRGGVGFRREHLLSSLDWITFSLAPPSLLLLIIETVRQRQ